MEIQKFYGYDTLQSLYDELKRRGQTILETDGKGTEIERKWRIDPSVGCKLNLSSDVADGMYIVDILGVSQWYLSVNPEIRYRNVTHLQYENGKETASPLEYFLSYKSSDTGLKRTEYEFQIDQMTSMEILERLERRCTCILPTYGINKLTFLMKQRGDLKNRAYNLSYVEPAFLSLKYYLKDDLLILPSMVHGFVYLEVEFDSEEEAHQFALPAKFEKFHPVEVTNDPAYRMANYWKEKKDQYTVRNGKETIRDGDHKIIPPATTIPIKISTLQGLVNYYAATHPDQDVIATIKDGILSLNPVEDT